MPANDLLKNGQIALILGVNPKTVHRWGKEGRFGEAVAVGKQTCYRRDAVMARVAAIEAEEAERAELIRTQREKVGVAS